MDRSATFASSQARSPDASQVSGAIIQFVSEALADAYARVRRKAATLAAEPGDLVRRAVQLNSIYADSRGNHAFPQIALHAAVWAHRFFGATGPIARAISYRYSRDPAELERRNAMIQRFSDGFADANRTAFIDTYTDYYFTKDYGDSPGAAEFVAPRLLECLNRVHHAVRFGRPVNVEDKYAIFIASLEWEQEVTVEPRVKEEVGKLDCPIVTGHILKPFVRFAYFPHWYYLYFKNFSATEERIEKGIESYRLATSAGWPAVVDTMRNYDVLPEGLSFSA